MLKVKDRCTKVNIITGKPETQFKGSNSPKIYVVKSADPFNGSVMVYNNDKVVFDLQGNVLIAPPVIGKDSSNWIDCKLVKFEG